MSLRIHPDIYGRHARSAGIHPGRLLNAALDRFIDSTPHAVCDCEDTRCVQVPAWALIARSARAARNYRDAVNS